MTAPARLAVDLIACDGRGLCAELLPELITLDDWGYPMLARREVPAALRGEASAAVQLCPKLALRLETTAARNYWPVRRQSSQPVRSSITTPTASTTSTV